MDRSADCRFAALAPRRTAPTLNPMQVLLASFMRHALAIFLTLAVSMSANGTESKYEGYDPKNCIMWSMTGNDFDYSNTKNNKNFGISASLRSSAESAVNEVIAQKKVPQFYEGQSFGVGFSRKKGSIGTSAPTRNLYCMYDDGLRNIKCTVESENGLVSYKFDLQSKPEISYRCSSTASGCPVPRLVDAPEEDWTSNSLYRRTLTEYAKQCTLP